MSHQPDHAFRVRAILWLQSKMGMPTSVMPTHRIEDDHGRGRLEAYVVRSNRWSDLMFLSLCLLGVAAFFALIASRPDVQGVRSIIVPIQWVGLVGGLVLAAAGAVLYRQSRETIVVELRLMIPHYRPIQRAAIEALRRDADVLAAWMVSEIPYEPEALEVARLLQVKCFFYREGKFEELGSIGSDGAAEPTVREPIGSGMSPSPHAA